MTRAQEKKKALPSDTVATEAGRTQLHLEILLLLQDCAA
jgi:hypothetical protein